MLKSFLFSMFLYFVLLVIDEVFKEEGDIMMIHRNRMLKFALYQDLLVVLTILKMMVIEGYTICGVVERIRSSGLVTRLYFVTSVVLHGTLLFDESTNHELRLRPVPYIPPGLDENQKDLFLL